ncbi:MAG TPA: response regulator transcription factor [Acidimicrobiia bacterium]|nr:response regulator transcription factor [Acidimicrobiia bacterium]
MRVLVVDDTARVRTSLSRALTLEGFTVDTAADAREAQERVSGYPPAVMILDWVLPGVDGLEFCARLRETGHTFPILMLTVRDQVADRVAGLRVGADDYLAKPFALEELIARIRALLRRTVTAANSSEQITFADLTVDTATRTVRRQGREIELTPTEYRLLLYLLSHPRRVLTKSQILEAVWGFPADTSSNTLEVYIGYLRRKLEEGGEPRLVHTVRGIGYVLRAP